MDKIKQQTVVTEAMHRIKAMIESNKYGVGDKLPTEAQLAESFGIGRSSIREAIKVFQYLGILETKVPKGTFICSTSNIASEFFTWFALLEKKYIFEILEMREAFEQKGINHLIQDYKEKQPEAASAMRILEALLSDFSSAIALRDYNRLNEVDFQFHRTLIAYSNNTLFLQIYDQLKEFTITEMHKTHLTYKDLSVLHEEHARILDAIRKNDFQLAIEFHAYHFPLIRSNLKFD